MSADARPHGPATAARLRSAILRRMLRQLVRPRRRPDLVRLGSAYGGWWVPAAEIGSGTVAYCAGAGEDITFELALLNRGCRVTAFDPTPRAVAHVAAVAPEDPGFRFRPVGWWDDDAELRFYAPRDPAHVSHSALNLQRTSAYFLAPVRPVRQLMAELGDSGVDLIKMDIEGAEQRVLSDLLRRGPLPTVLCVEFDQPQPLAGVLRAVRRLRRAGYTVDEVEGWNVSLSRR